MGRRAKACGQNLAERSALLQPENSGVTHESGALLSFAAVWLAGHARVAKLVDAGDLKSPSERSAGSSPAPGTTLNSKVFIEYRTRRLETLGKCSER